MNNDYNKYKKYKTLYKNLIGSSSVNQETPPKYCKRAVYKQKYKDKKKGDLKLKNKKPYCEETNELDENEDEYCLYDSSIKVKSKCKLRVTSPESQPPSSHKKVFILAVGNTYHPGKYQMTIDPLSLVGCKLKVKWKTKHYTCTVDSYNPTNDTHYCIYDDGDRREYNIKTKSFKVISLPDATKKKSYKFNANITESYRSMDITNEIKEYIIKHNLDSITIITSEITNGFIKEIRDIVAKHHLSTDWKNDKGYQAYTKWNIDWEKLPSNKILNFSVDIDIYLPYCDILNPTIINDLIQNQIKGLRCHEMMHRDNILNGLKTIRTRMETYSDKDLENIGIVNNDLHQLFERIREDDIALDANTDHGCNYGSGIFKNTCSITC